MASLYKRSKSPFWYAAYFRADGSRAYRSTGCKRKSKANEVTVGWEKAEAKTSKAHAELQPDIAAVVSKAGREASSGKLTLDRARKHLMEIYRLSSAEAFPTYSVKEWLNHWLSENQKRVSDATLYRYRNSVNAVLAVLKSKQEMDIALLTTGEVQRVQTVLASSPTKASTTNLKVQDFKAAIRAAFEQGVIERNVGLPVKPLPTEDSDLRGEFTVAEIRQLMSAASPDWRGAILIAAQTGLRLSNVAELKWDDIDLKQRELVLAPVKQRRGKSEVISIPMSDSVFEFLTARSNASKLRQAPVFGTLSGRKKATLSTTFNNLMTKAKMKKEVNLPGGKVARRSFHSLRHFYVSALANANVPEDVRRTLAAHKSGDVHRIYTHHNKETLKLAIDALPGL